jgi:predicted outer membrane repeat protein
LPSGVTLSSGGVLSGTPAAGTGGSYALTITASNGIGSNATQSFTLTVNQAPAITSAGGTTFTAGTAGRFTVTASGYPTPTFSETGALPTGVTLSSAGVLSGTPTGASDIYLLTITARNGVGSNLPQRFTLTVNPGPATHLVIPSGPEPFYTAFGFSITAEDAYGNLATSYNGTVAFTSSDPGFVNLGPVTLVNGVGSQSAVLKTAGVDTITATDISNSSITGTGSFTIQPGQASRFGVSAPSASNAGSPFNFTVTAYDLYGNVATGYTGTATFTSTDGAASLPSLSGLTAGTGTFNATLVTAGLQTITATDAANSLAGTSGTITVSIPNFVVNVISDDAGSASNCALQSTAGTTTNSDSCSLRDALLAAAANGSGSISFDSTVFAAATSISLTNNSLPIAGSTSITGPTSGSGYTLTNLVTVNGEGIDSVFTVNSGATASISGLVITGGVGNNAGGIVNHGTLTVSGSTITGNTASANSGGGINCVLGASLTVIDSTVSNNSASVQGGAIFLQTGTLVVTNSTISGNNAGTLGGGIMIDGGTATVTSSTVANNSGGSVGGGIENDSGTLTLKNTAVFGNTASTGPNVNGSYSGAGNQIGTAITFSALASYGGPTQTMVPLPGSPAICGGLQADISSGVTTDQRGFPNTNIAYPGYNAGAPCVDSGAVQTNYAISFTAEPPASIFVEEAMTPAPAVGLTESGIVATVPTSAINMTDGASQLYGVTAVNLSSGLATFTNISTLAPVSNDTLTATLALNASLSPALNLTAQSAAYLANAPVPATLTFPTPSTTLTGASATFTWSGGAGVQEYDLIVGTTGVGSSDVYDSGGTTATSLTVTVPTTGATLYVRFRQRLSAVWQSADYTYTEFGAAIPPAINSPTSGSTLTGASVTFNWAGSNISQDYELLVGASGVGSSDVYDSGVTTAISATIPVPTTGATLYVRLRHEKNGIWQSIDYTYTESGAPVLAAISSPAPGSTLTGASVTFNWAGSNVSQQYELLVGTTGVGSSNVYSSGVTTATSETVTVPTTGAALYVRLRQESNGVWQSTDYTYTEQ